MALPFQIFVPGRVNLIGEHVDYHDLPVLPIAIPRYISLTATATPTRMVAVESAGYGLRTVPLGVTMPRASSGDWGNYLVAAVQAVGPRWPMARGFHGYIHSDLPSAAGLSSSSALLTALTLALLQANDIQPSLDELMAVLPEAEQFVGTRGGGMDHAAVLGSRAGCASFIRFSPFGLQPVPLPADWQFLVAHCLVRAEKSGAAQARFNDCRAAGLRALTKFRLPNYQAALETGGLIAQPPLTLEETSAFQHVVGEAARVKRAALAIQTRSRQDFGYCLNESHASLRDLLKVSCPALDRIVAIAQDAGADGARLTGAGFGGCALILSSRETQDKVIAALERGFYANRTGYRREDHLFAVTPVDGALYGNTD